MKKLIVASFVIVMVAFLTGQAIATKPGEDTNPNGFISGPHHNMNIIGKKPGFTCPEQKYYSEVDVCVHDDGLGGSLHSGLVKDCDPEDSCTLTDIPVYGKVIFVPQNGEDIKIYMESGKKGGKGQKNQDLPDTLQVTDPCTSAFDGTPARVQIPKGEHRVFARALATPGEEVQMWIDPSLVMVEDENGNNLVYLGLLTDEGFQPVDQPFVRPKGKPKAAVDITGLFQWTGEVWYFEEPAGGYEDTKWVCCRDTSDPADGIYDECIPATIDLILGPLCPEVAPDEVPYTLELVYLNSYEQEWVFNIGDFVTYLWSIDNSGLKLLQVRFYPVDPAPEPAPSRINTLATQWGKIRSE